MLNERHGLSIVKECADCTRSASVVAEDDTARRYKLLQMWFLWLKVSGDHAAFLTGGVRVS